MTGNLLKRIMFDLIQRKVTKSAAATLTKGEVEQTLIVADGDGSAVALTLPAAAADLEGFFAIVANAGSSDDLTLVCTAGYAGLGAAGDTYTIAAGDFAIVICDGSAWYGLHVTTAA